MTDEEYLAHKQEVKWAIEALRTGVVRSFRSDGTPRTIIISTKTEMYGAQYRVDPSSPAGARLKIARSFGLDYLEREPEELIKGAGQHEQYFDALTEGLAILLETEHPIPTSARKWLANYLRGEVKPPKRKAGADSREWLHLSIASIISSLRDKGVKPTRGDAAKVHRSGCDIVAEVLREAGLEPTTFEGVKKVWLNKKFRPSALPNASRGSTQKRG